MCCKALTTNFLVRNQKKGWSTFKQKTRTQWSIFRKPNLNLKPYNFWDFDDLQTLHNYIKQKNTWTFNGFLNWKLVYLFAFNLVLLNPLGHKQCVSIAPKLILQKICIYDYPSIQDQILTKEPPNQIKLMIQKEDLYRDLLGMNLKTKI
jgi:hypothetical protein